MIILRGGRNESVGRKNTLGAAFFAGAVGFLAMVFCTGAAFLTTGAGALSSDGSKMLLGWGARLVRDMIEETTEELLGAVGDFLAAGEAFFEGVAAFLEGVAAFFAGLEESKKQNQKSRARHGNHAGGSARRTKMELIGWSERGYHLFFGGIVQGRELFGNSNVTVSILRLDLHKSNLF